MTLLFLLSRWGHPGHPYLPMSKHSWYVCAQVGLFGSVSRGRNDTKIHSSLCSVVLEQEKRSFSGI